MEQDGSRRRRRRLWPTYRISDLPDDVLHRILLRLGCAPAAARTSVLSWRWRRVWARLPGLVFRDYGQLRNRAFLSSVDGGLARYSSPTLRGLYISMFHVASRVPTARVAGWLRFAAVHVAGDLCLCLPWRPAGGDAEELGLPLCVGARTIQLSLGHGFRQLRLPRSGAFASLTLMAIRDARIDARDLERVVCWQCPFLLELHLVAVSLVAVSDEIILRSTSLRRLNFDVGNTSRLVLDTPSIEELSVSKLAKVSVAALNPAETVPLRDADDPRRRRLPARHLRWLAVKGRSHQVMPVLMRHFDTVDQLELDLAVSSGEEYKSFLRATNKLAKCDVLVVKLTTEWHAYEPSLLYLLRKPVGTRKVVVHLPWTTECSDCSPCLPGCTCGRKGSLNTDYIKLESLEVVEINDFTGEDHQVKILKLLLSCKSISASRIVVNISRLVRSLGEATCQRIRDEAHHPGPDIRFNVWLNGRWEPYA
ncbi:putative FBD-associated F-box protein At5g56400 [Panicum virgatum]|nr:putative FBD-associated F-box protein At5g56400 [Panicum virgatum]